DAPFGLVLAAWALIVVACGVAFWSASALGRPVLVAGGRPLGGGIAQRPEAVYFSFVTATSVGFGDVVPIGLGRVLAIMEAAAELLLFGALVSKLVSQKQEMLVEELHRATFEDRLGRVRTNLHLLGRELSSLATDLADDATAADRALPRIESA